MRAHGVRERRVKRVCGGGSRRWWRYFPAENGSVSAFGSVSSPYTPARAAVRRTCLHWHKHHRAPSRMSASSSSNPDRHDQRPRAGRSHPVRRRRGASASFAPVSRVSLSGSRAAAEGPLGGRKSAMPGGGLRAMFVRVRIARSTALRMARRPSALGEATCHRAASRDARRRYEGELDITCHVDEASHLGRSGDAGAGASNRLLEGGVDGSGERRPRGERVGRRVEHRRLGQRGQRLVRALSTIGGQL